MSAVGGYTNPKYPELPGLDSFQGQVVHTAKWQQEYDLRGRDVVIIGNGCEYNVVLPSCLQHANKSSIGSASQVVPAIIEDVGSLTQFIRVSEKPIQDQNISELILSTESSVLCSNAQHTHKSNLAESLSFGPRNFTLGSMACVLGSRDLPAPILRRRKRKTYTSALQC